MNPNQNISLELNTSLEEEKEKHKHHSSELVEVEDIDNCPIKIVGNKDYGYFLAFGKYRLESTNHPTKLDALLSLETNKWNILTNLILTIIEDTREAPIYGKAYIQTDKINNPTHITNKI